MPAIAATAIIHPKQLSSDERAKLTDALYHVHCQIFDGVDKSSFVKYVVESKAQQTAIHVHKNTAGDIVGYFAFHIFEKALSGKPVAVFRGEAGSLREYRGNNANVRIALNYILRYRLAHPQRPLYYLGTLVHPSSYMFCAKYGSVVWPNRHTPLPPAIATFLAEMALVFGLEAVDPQNPLVVQVGWRTRDTEVERNYWRTCDKPDARFFVEQNPGYSEGQGLITLLPLPTSTLVRSAGRIVRDRTQRYVEPSLMSLQQLPLLRQLFGVQDIQRRIKRTPLFAELTDADLALIAQAAEVLTLPSGRYVFRSGDAGDELYVVAAGAVVAVLEQEGGERLIDQIAPGAMFGEIAMLSGEPRSASIRTAGKATLIRIKRKALLDLMATQPPIREAIWSVFARRRFLDLTAGPVAHLGVLSRQQRLDWFARGQFELLPAQTQATIADPWLFLLTGTVTLQQPQGWSTLRAPALLQLQEPVQVMAQTPTQLVRLPAVEDQAVSAFVAAVGALATDRETI
ncbi:MAG: cyclic nucleotide-binding domain-containing protein [Caldilineaceae bacterium]